MNTMAGLVQGLDRGFYREAATLGRSAGAHLAALAEQKGLAADGEEAAAREREYLAHFHAADDYSPFAERVRRFARQTWALERAFEELGIRLKGPEADALGKVFATSGSTVLFPTFVETQVVAGLLATSLVPYIVAQEVMVDSHTAEHLALTENEAERRTSKTNEGARGTVVTVRTADRSIKLDKYMAQLDATYEALRLQRMNVVSVFLQRLGQQIGIDETDDAIQVAIAGDGNTGSAVTDTDAEVSGTLDYDELIRLRLAFPISYEWRVAITSDLQLRTILNMAEFKDPLAGFNFQRTGTLVDPIGAAWHRWTSTGSAAFSTDRILALDTRLAMVQYTEQGVATESDRLIDRQFEQTVVSKWTGFGKLDYSATQCLDIVT
jgi:hypothetical protein